MRYFGGSSRFSDPALARNFIEAELMEEYHWLPKEIGEIPYKTLQKMFIIQRQRSAARQTKMQTQQFKSEHSTGRGRTKRYREV